MKLINLDEMVRLKVIDNDDLLMLNDILKDYTTNNGDPITLAYFTTSVVLLSVGQPLVVHEDTFEDPSWKLLEDIITDIAEYYDAVYNNNTDLE